MATGTVPYMTAYGRLSKALEKLREAQTPPRFTQDFLDTKLGLKGGSARPVIPFLKRTGFLGSDGTPTELYNQFRNKAQGGAAAAEALRIGYAPLYEVNEYVHDLNDDDLKGVIVQVTGAEENASAVQAIVGSFKALRAFADFEAKPTESAVDEIPVGEGSTSGGRVGSLKLGYTINLNLPATSDIAVFDAIFKSLRQNLIP